MFFLRLEKRKKATHKSTLLICVSLPKEGDRGLPACLPAKPAGRPAGRPPRRLSFFSLATALKRLTCPPGLGKRTCFFIKTQRRRPCFLSLENGSLHHICNDRFLRFHLFTYIRIISFFLFLSIVFK